MELHALISLFCVILWQVVGVEPIYHVARLSDQPVRIVAIIKARPLVMRAMLIKSIKRTEAQDRMFLLAGQCYIYPSIFLSVCMSVCLYVWVCVLVFQKVKE